MGSPVLVIAVGNESRGDDALAPLLLRALQEQMDKGRLHDRVEMLEDFQLQIEHAADLLERELVLFIDAGMNTPAPYHFYRIQPNSGSTLFSHALAPEDVLTTYVQVYRQTPPPAFVLCISGDQFELGAALSAKAAQHLASAATFAHGLLQDTRSATWEASAAG